MTAAAGILFTSVRVSCTLVVQGFHAKLPVTSGSVGGCYAARRVVDFALLLCLPQTAHTVGADVPEWFDAGKVYAEAHPEVNQCKL
jgi:hypothetical protein